MAQTFSRPVIIHVLTVMLRKDWWKKLCLGLGNRAIASGMKKTYSCRLILSSKIKCESVYTEPGLLKYGPGTEPVPGTVYCS